MKRKIESINTSYISDDNLQSVDVYFQNKEQGKSVCVLCLDSRKLIWKDMNYRFNEQVNDAIKKMLNDKPLKPRFPNGFEKWQETHCEVVAKVALEMAKEEPRGLVHETNEAGGWSELYNLIEDLTHEFEKIHQGHQWDDDFWTEIDEFLRIKLYSPELKYKPAYEK